MVTLKSILPREEGEREREISLKFFQRRWMASIVCSIYFKEIQLTKRNNIISWLIVYATQFVLPKNWEIVILNESSDDWLCGKVYEILKNSIYNNRILTMFKTIINISNFRFHSLIGFHIYILLSRLNRWMELMWEFFWKKRKELLVRRTAVDFR